MYIHLYVCVNWQSECKIYVEMQIFKDSQDNPEGKYGWRPNDVWYPKWLECYIVREGIVWYRFKNKPIE